MMALRFTTFIIDSNVKKKKNKACVYLNRIIRRRQQSEENINRIYPHTNGK